METGEIQYLVKYYFSDAGNDSPSPPPSKSSISFANYLFNQACYRYYRSVDSSDIWNALIELLDIPTVIEDIREYEDLSEDNIGFRIDNLRNSNIFNFWKEEYLDWEREEILRNIANSGMIWVGNRKLESYYTYWRNEVFEGHTFFSWSINALTGERKDLM